MDLPGFLPRPEPLTDSSPTQPHAAASPPGSATPADTASSASPTGTTTANPGPSPASTADSIVFARVDREAIERALGAVIRVVTRVIHRRLAPRHPDARAAWYAEGIWKADTEDIREMAQPAARILARRVRVPAELADAVAVAFGTAGYVEKNLDADSEFRAAHAHVLDLSPDEYH